MNKIFGPIITIIGLLWLGYNESEFVNDAPHLFNSIATSLQDGHDAETQFRRFCYPSTLISFPDDYVSQLTGVIAVERTIETYSWVLDKKWGWQKDWRSQLPVNGQGGNPTVSLQREITAFREEDFFFSAPSHPLLDCPDQTKPIPAVSLPSSDSFKHFFRRESGRYFYLRKHGSPQDEVGDQRVSYRIIIREPAQQQRSSGSRQTKLSPDPRSFRASPWGGRSAGLIAVISGIYLVLVDFLHLVVGRSVLRRIVLLGIGPFSCLIGAMLGFSVIVIGVKFSDRIALVLILILSTLASIWLWNRQVRSTASARQLLKQLNSVYRSSLMHQSSSNSIYEFNFNHLLRLTLSSQGGAKIESKFLVTHRVLPDEEDTEDTARG